MPRRYPLTKYERKKLARQHDDRLKKLRLLMARLRRKA